MSMSSLTSLTYWLQDRVLYPIQNYWEGFTLWLCRPWSNIREEHWQIVAPKPWELTTNLNRPANCCGRTHE